MPNRRRRETVENAFYFAYHLDMNPSLLVEHGVPIVSMRPAVLEGYQLVFNVLEDEAFYLESRGLANLTPMVGARTEGVLYEAPGDALTLLDRIAGVPELKYYRKIVPILLDTKHVDAFTYIAWPDVTAINLLPSRRYLKRLIHAAKRPGCSNRFLQWLAAHPTVR